MNKLDKVVLEETLSLHLLGLLFTSKLDWGSYIISIAKAASKKIGALLHSVKFLSPELELVLYFYKSTIRQCIEYCCHVWSGAGKCYLNLLDKLQRRTCNVVVPELSASFQSLAHHQDVTSLSLFYRYFFGRCSSELFELVPLPHVCGHSIRYSNRLHDFVVTVPHYSKEVYASSVFPQTAKLWNSLPGNSIHIIG